MNDAMLEGTFDRTTPSLTNTDDAAGNELDFPLDPSTIDVDQFFQDPWEPEAGLSLLSWPPSSPPAWPSQLGPPSIPPWTLEAAPSNVLPWSVSGGFILLFGRVDLTLDHGGRSPCETLDFAVEDPDGEQDGNFLMLEGNFNTATTGPTLDQHDTLPFSQERTAGQLSPPTPPTPLSQSMLPCLEDHSSLSVPHATVGPGGRPLHKTLKNGSPRSKLTVYERDGKLQFPLAKGTKIKVGILQEYLKRIPDARKSQSGTVNPLLGVSTLVLSKDEYVDIALAMYSTSKDQQTATRNLRKLWCIFCNDF